ncbi:hypothetical protein HYPSUDRAFT_49018 [Hypholoma sublateritium FD-334 SS-4]|uniref:Uncharacterized protein n=1 Tax=Hypholoma sublateritium (strain FD-334 SS-4) TaxID=945553 RepID=A0A0D2NDA1_HYPSF|nr:hypothetical protein HYPSUDRAFT_49018 [Hypholoma sublateritium FD-334 SS-4]
MGASCYLNPNNTHTLLPYAYAYAPSTRSTVFSTRQTDGAYVATDPFRAHSRNDGLGHGLTFDDVPTPTIQPYSAHLAASMSTYTLPFPYISNQSHLPEHPNGGYYLQPVQPSRQLASAQPDLGSEIDFKSALAQSSFPQPRQSFEYPSALLYPSALWYAIGHSNQEKNVHSSDENLLPGPSAGVVEPPKPDDLVAVDQLGVGNGSDNIYPPRHLGPDAPDVPSVSLPGPLLPTHHSHPLNAHKPQKIWSRINGQFGRLFPSRPDARRKMCEAASFVGETLPRQIYLHFLLRLPSLYFSRVARIFEEADLTLPEIKRMALETASQGSGSANLNNFDALTLQAGIMPVPPHISKRWKKCFHVSTPTPRWRCETCIYGLMGHYMVRIKIFPASAKGTQLQ